MKRKILSLLMITFIVIKAYPQSFVSQIIRGERGISKQFASLDNDHQVPFNTAQIKSLLDLNQTSELVLQRTEQDKLGFIHYRYYQTYKGIAIENTMYIIHTKNGLLKSLSGAIVTDFDSRMDERSAQKISNTQAVNIAVNYVGAKVYAWQDAEMEQRIKEQTKNPKASYLSKAGLVWYSATDDINPRELRLCYKVDVYARQPLSRAYYFVDAISGKVLGKKDEIFYSDATGTAHTAYSGNQTIHSDFTGTKYRLRDYTKGAGIITLHGESGKRGNEYTSTSANWTLTGTSIAALDAHYGVSQTYAFYKTNFNRNSYDDAGTALVSYVNDPTYLDNAFWDGTEMNFNERSDGNPGGVTGIDVTGHELTHGVTQETSALNYSNESGAMNESMSDIMGKSVQFWSKPGDVNWEISNDMGWIIRSMSNPNSQDQPDTYKGTHWSNSSNQDIVVHTNSGVGNFMFYLLVAGGSGTNDKGDGYSVTGIGLSKADQILYRTDVIYLTPTSKYADWRTACMNAATDLYGTGSNEVVQVENAWHAVGVGNSSDSCDMPKALKATFISGTSEKISWNAATGAQKYNLQYKTSSATAWTTISNIIPNSYTLTGLSAGVTYKCNIQTVCSGSTRSAHSNALSFMTSSPYCAISGNTAYEYINNVTIGSINNTSGDDGGYGDYTSLSTNLAAGSSANIRLTSGFTSLAYAEYWTVYIDYNQNGVFTDPGEMVTSGHSISAIVKTFTVASTAKNGSTRMRIIMHFDAGLAGTCGTFTDGEAEDYTVNITGGTLAAGFTSADNTRANALSNIIITPNPVKGSVANLELQVNKTGPVNIRITDLSGRTLRAETINNIVAGKNNYLLNNLNILPGTYMIIAEQSNDIVGRAQFIVAK